MVWEIVSFGNVNSLNLTFNAIASIFADGGYKSAAIAIILFVVVGSSMKSLTDGKQELPYAKILAAIIIYVMGFNTFTTVSIENRYDSTVTRIDHVPVAIAVPASLISQVGLYMAEAVETAFGNTDSDMEKVTATGYLSPLKLLADIRDRTMYRCPAGSQASTGSGIDLCQSLPNYISECAMVKANRDNKYLTMSETNYLDAIQFPSEAFATQLIKDDGSPVVMGCKEAGELIQDTFSSATFDNMVEKVMSGMVSTGEDGITKTQDAVKAIGIDSGQARNLLQTMFMRKAAEEGELSFYMRTGASDLAENLNSSIEQRNYAWTLQGEMWVQLVDKFISIMECLIYAMAPFIGLMVLTGSLGAKTFLIYLQMLAVIQIMPAMQVIAQNIVLADMIDYTKELTARGYEVGSMEYDFRLLDKAKELIGLGGWIAATIVPAMAMTLVTGSGMAMMGAMKGAAATPKDTDAVPDLAGQGGSSMNLGVFNEGTQGQFGNVATKSALTQVGTISNSAGLKNAISHAEARKTEASKSWSTSNASAQVNSEGRSYTSQEMRSMSDSMTSTNAETQAWGTQLRNAISKDESLTNEEKSQLGAATSLGLKVAGMGGVTDDRFTEGLSKNVREAYNKIMAGTYSNEMNSILEQGKTALKSDSVSVGENNSYMDSKLRELKTSSENKASSSNAYEKLKSAETALGVKDEDLMTNMYMQAHEKGGYERALRQADQWATEWSDHNDGKFRFYHHKLEEFTGGVNGNKFDEKTATLMAVAATAQAFDEQSAFLNDVWVNNKPSDNKANTVGGIEKTKTSKESLNDESNDGGIVSAAKLKEGFDKAPEHKYISKPTTQIEEPSKTIKTFNPDQHEANVADVQAQQTANNKLVNAKRENEHDINLDGVNLKDFQDRLASSGLDHNKAEKLYYASRDTDSGGAIGKFHDYLIKEGYLENPNNQSTTYEAAVYNFMDDVKGEAVGILEGMGFNFSSNPEQKSVLNTNNSKSYLNDIPK